MSLKLRQLKVVHSKKRGGKNKIVFFGSVDKTKLDKKIRRNEVK